jgi:hypothetical protein
LAIAKLQWRSALFPSWMTELSSDDFDSLLDVEVELVDLLLVVAAFFFEADASPTASPIESAATAASMPTAEIQR